MDLYFAKKLSSFFAIMMRQTLNRTPLKIKEAKKIESITMNNNKIINKTIKNEEKRNVKGLLPENS